MKFQILQQGAEAIIKKQGKFIIKQRIKKSYRIPELDESIRKKRTKSETKLLEKASKIINSPKPEETKDKFAIKIPFIKGKKLSEHLDKLNNKEKIMHQIGQEIAKLHDANIIHGDLTTSNMILKDNKVFLIDFGLGFNSNKIEDKAVDIHLLKQALEAKHFKFYEKLFSLFLKGYKLSKNYKPTLERLNAVESRGRYKH